MRLLALRITATTYRGALKGIPNLVDMLRRHQAGASFLFCMGPDNSGRSLSRIFQSGYLKQASRTRALSHYGARSLFNGTLLPATQIGRRAASIVHGVSDSGFEVGIHGWDAYAWKKNAEHANPHWTQGQMQQACSRYTDLFKAAPRVHAAVNWQMNAHAMRLTQRMGFRYASDTRGTHPFMPVQNGEIILCPQVPTTLPTTDELIGFDGVNESNVAEALLRETSLEPQHGHVFTLSAEREGIKLAPAFEKMLTGWREQGYSIVAMQDIVDRIDRDTLPHHQVIRGTVPGRLGTLMVQGAEFLANWQTAA